MWKIKVYTKNWKLIGKEYFEGDRQQAELFAEKMRDELLPDGYFEISKIR